MSDDAAAGELPGVVERANLIFEGEIDAIRRRCDAVFVKLMAAQWAFAVVAAVTLSPFTYDGARASIHLHVIFAVAGGGFLAVGPWILSRARPGSAMTRHVMAVAQMLWSALLIHLSGGRIETHFHIFGSLAFLAFYRDWKVILTASVFVAADHLARGVFYPQSVYGVANPEWWRFLEHAGWVAFEDVVLVMGIRGSLQEMRTSTNSRAELHCVNAHVEEIVDERTAELAASREQYKMLVEGTSAVPWIWEKAARRFTYVGPQAGAVTGIPSQQWLEGGFWRAHVHAEDVGGIGTANDAAQTTGAAQSIEYRLQRDDGELIWVRSVIAPHDPADPYIRGILVDVTAHRELESELRQAQKLSAIGSLAAGVAHELNTPIQYVSDNARFLSRAFTKLVGVLDVLRGEMIKGELPVALAQQAAGARLDYLQDQIPRALEQSLEGLHRVAAIVRAMKELSHPSKGEKTLVSLRDSIETTATVARNEWKYVADLEIDVDAALPPVPALRDELNQVFLNIIVNAAHAIAEKNAGTDRRGVIRIGASVDDDWATVSISDDGAGIPDQVKARVFEPFFTTKDVGRGTGQGLAIAWSVVVDKHGGSINLESKVGAGTTFHIRLPRHGDQAQHHDAAQTAATAATAAPAPA